MSDQTLGQKRVKAEFNPAKNTNVDEIKNLSAKAIDIVEQLRDPSEPIENEDGTHTLVGYSEKDRLIDLAQQHYETACMYAVKANFTK